MRAQRLSLDQGCLQLWARLQRDIRLSKELTAFVGCLLERRYLACLGRECW